MRGFTLIELVIVLSITLMLSAIVGALSSNTLPKTRCTAKARQSLRISVVHKRSVSPANMTSFGVHLTSTNLTLLRGQTTRCVTLNTIRYARFSRHHSHRIKRHPFAALSGSTSNTGTIILTADATSETEVITVNARGLVEK